MSCDIEEKYFSSSEDEDQEREERYMWRNCKAHGLDEGSTYLHVEAKSANLDHVSTLLQHGANPDVRNDCGETPLHHACGDTEDRFHMVGIDEEKQVSAAKILLEAGADPWLRCQNKRLPLHVAVLCGRVKLMEFMLDHMLDDDTSGHILDEAMLHVGSIEVGRRLLEMGADVNWKDVDLRTPLLCAAAAGRDDVVEWMVEEVDANVDCLDSEDVSVLTEVLANCVKDKSLPDKLVGKGATLSGVKFHKVFQAMYSPPITVKANMKYLPGMRQYFALCTD